ncbi:kinase-like domain-containing protein [Achaetomium macrosporum]|uniref:Kinase-like domain-containing protein n=1 Tax=Achaetomium macrosporum TaxID=79813 RepID=A0AAN7HEH4_9PEZI|nr:kinase-like domain-containing protein [Achaetomium macrosporum]
MEIVEQGECFVEKDNDFVFGHTKIILRRKDDGKYFFARSPGRMDTVTPDNIKGPELIEIPAEIIWPVFNSKFTQASQPLPERTYVKRPRLLVYDDAPASQEYSKQLLREIDICELLAKHPHPNLVEYLGCVVEEGRMVGLCLKRYDMTLWEKVDSGVAFDRKSCLQGIEDGLNHLHRLGLIHNDLNPRNIMVDKDGAHPVIIGFDSCRREGEELGLKGGIAGWGKEGITHASRENDFYALSLIRGFLMKENLRN